MQTNDPAHPLQTLTCSGIAEEAVSVRPAIAQFGGIKRNSAEVTRVIKLRSSAAGPISPKVLPIRQRGDSLDAQLCEVIPGEEYDLRVTMAPPWPAGKVQVPVRIDIGVEGAMPLLIYAMATVQERVATNPGNLYFPKEPGEKREQTFSLIWSGGSPGKILDLSSTIAGAELHATEKNGAHRITVTLGPDVVPSAQAHRVTIRTDDPEAGTVVVPVTFRRMKTAKRGIAGRAKTSAVIQQTSTTPAPRGSGRRALRLSEYREQRATQDASGPKLQAAQKSANPATP